jgi:hypothetical protein
MLNRLIGNGEAIVDMGPFSGMKYKFVSSGSEYLPKILGSYEEPIHNQIEEIIENKYDNIINIGCGEGYYAIGFAIKCPNAKIFACDINQQSLISCKKNSELNNVYSNITFIDRCSHEFLNRAIYKNTLIFCDIEGEELNLLSPEFNPSLKSSDILVETHNFINPNISSILKKYFYKTHSIIEIFDYPFRKNKYGKNLDISDEEIIMMQNENRPALMSWLYMKSYKQG